MKKNKAWYIIELELGSQSLSNKHSDYSPFKIDTRDRVVLYLPAEEEGSLYLPIELR